MKKPLDSWVLLSVVMCGRKRGTLRDVIACGDYANHAMFPFERLRDGMYLLQRAGLVICEDGRYRSALRANRLWQKAQKKERRLLKAWELLDQWIGRQAPTAVTGGIRRITRRKYNAAVKEYLDTF